MTKKQGFKLFFLVFLILQPIFDSYYLYSDKVINFLGFSPTTIIRVIIVAIYCFVIFIKKDNKSRKFEFVTIGLITIYFLVHHLVSNSFDDSIIYNTFKYSTFEEIFYILRMCLPIGVIYITYNLKYTKKELKLVIKFSALILASIIILLNISEIARTSYGNSFIGGNIFDWFNSNVDRYTLASKGWFNSANQIGATLIILIIMMYYFTMSDKKVSDLIVMMLLILSSMMIGTRISTIGVLLIVIALALCFLFMNIINKKMKKIKLWQVLYTIITICFTLSVFTFAPIVNCRGNNYKCLLNSDGELEINGIDKTQGIKNLTYDGGNVCKFLDLTSVSSDYFKKLYPCQENIIFWQNIVDNKIYEYANNRVLEKLVTDDIYSRIENKVINLFGMGRSRFLSAGIYLERDIYVHYYTIGIVGIILFILVPYLLPCILLSIKMIKNKCINSYNFSLLSCIIILIFISYLGGHVLDELIVTLYMGFVVGFIALNINQKKEKEYLKRTLIVNDERMMGGVSILLEDILNNIDKSINIDLLILHDNGTRLKKLPSNVNVIYGTKFFRVVDLHIGEVLKTKNIGLIFNKIELILLMKTHLISFKIKHERNKILKYKYEQEIAFKDGFCGLFVAHGDANKKIQWLHSDYAKKDYLRKYRSLFMKDFNKIDTFVAVSKNVGNNFNAIYHQENKTKVIKNLVDDKKIKEKSTEYNVKYDGNINFVSVGRLHKDKGFDRVIETLAKLKEEKKLKNVKYYIIGDGAEYNNLKNLINDKDLNDTVELLGRKENPYPYFKAADLFIMSSLHESYGLVIIESLILGVPVLSTKIATIDEILNEKYGLIVDNSIDGLYNGIRKIIDEKLILKWKNNLKKYKYDNKSIINEIEELLSLEE